MYILLTLFSMKYRKGPHMFRRTLLKLIIILFVSTYGYCLSPPFSGDHPWFTGPLFTPSARVVPAEHFNIEPYCTWVVNTGAYDNDGKVVSAPRYNQITSQLVCKVGLIDRVDFSLNAQSSYNWLGNLSATGFRDLSVGFDFQLIEDSKDGMPLRLAVYEIFPTGRYENLKPRLLGVDSIGSGSYATHLGLSTSRLFHFEDNRYLNARCTVLTILYAPASVHGLNSYGGDPTTHGTIHPGFNYAVLLGAEYTLTDNWVLALDIINGWSSKSTFKGDTIFPVGLRAGSNFSVAPAIEYNWSKTIGVIVGGWCSFAGCNSPQFVGCSGAINVYF